MCHSIDMQEKALEEQQRNRVREIELRHNIVLTTGHHDGIRHIIGRCGTFLIILGTRLEQAELREAPVRF
ncbi:MAG: hypothetical protein PVS3B3_26410 [Ktedonobacteraceae bacterium]